LEQWVFAVYCPLQAEVWNANQLGCRRSDGFQIIRQESAAKISKVSIIGCLEIGSVAMAAYNCGPENCQKGNSEDLGGKKNILGKSTITFPKETGSYISAIPSHALCIESLEDHNFHLENLLMP